MTAFIWDRVCETSTSTGTGDVVLAGAIAGFQGIHDAAGGGYSTFPYLIEAVDANGVPTGDWEAGIGTLANSFTLSRLAVTASSNAGSLVDLAAGTKRVHVSATAGSRLNLRGCTLRRSSDLTAQNLTTATAIPWNSQDWINEPTNNPFHDNTTNPSRITLPANYSWSMLRLTGQLTLANITVGDYVDLKIRVSGGGVPIARTIAPAMTTTFSAQLTSMISQAGDADYFELYAQVGADTSVDIKANESWFQLEVVQ